jgi:protein required for attachment to host cells
MQLAHDTLVAVIDGEKFTLFRNSGSVAEPKLSAVANPDLGDADAIPSGGRHHSSSANPDDRQLVEDGHSAAVADQLNKMALKGEIGSIVIVSTRKALGEMRKHFDKTLQAKIVAEVAKEMTGRTADEIAAMLAKE